LEHDFVAGLESVERGISEIRSVLGFENEIDNDAMCRLDECARLSTATPFFFTSSHLFQALVHATASRKEGSHSQTTPRQRMGHCCGTIVRERQELFEA